MAEKYNTIRSSDECGEIVGITGRRVRQLGEDGMLPKLGPDKFDSTWLIWLRLGMARYGKLRFDKPTDPRVLVAIAWMSCSLDTWRNDLHHLEAIFTRNGYNREDMLIAIGEAKTWRRA
jgi:hypothetical protein